MPFNHKDKELIGGNAVKLFAFKTNDAMNEVIEEDYFKYWSEINKNDFILVSCSDGAFMGVVKSRGPTVIGPCGFPWAVVKQKSKGPHTINRLREEAKLLGINSFGKGVKELTAEIAAKQGAAPDGAA